jgi:MFS family permease
VSHPPPAEGSPRVGSPGVSRTAWLVVALLVPVALLNYLDRQMLAAMKPSIMADIPDIATRANWGIVLGSFKWIYAILSPLGGYVADRTSRRIVIVASLFVWSAVTWATGNVHSFESFVAARAIMGISEAFYIPAALALITDFHTGSTRSRAVGVHQTGIYAGVILGGFSGYVADDPALGWRLAFVACGIAGIVYAVPLFFLLRDPTHARASGDGPAFFAAVGELLRNRQFLLLVGVFTLPAIAGWVVKDWMPDILREKFGLGQGQAGVSAVLYVQLASLVGVVAGGWLADRLMHATDRGRIYTSALGMSFFLPALVGVGLSGTLGFAVACLVLFGIGWGFFDCNNMPILCQITRPSLRATGYGVMNLASTSCGGFADWGFGALRDAEVSLATIFTGFAATALVSVALVLLIRPDRQS